MSIVSELLADNWQVETMVQKKPDLQMRALLLGVKCVYTNTHTHTHTHTHTLQNKTKGEKSRGILSHNKGTFVLAVSLFASLLPSGPQGG